MHEPTPVMANIRNRFLFEHLAKDHLRWLPELGIGFYPVRDPPERVYDRAYFEKYVGYESTPIGKALNDFRVEFVAEHAGGRLVDIGVGCGSFIKRRDNIGEDNERVRTFGYDISESSVAWLIERGRYVNPFTQGMYAASFWDSLEHIEDFRPILAKVSTWVFVTVPIFRNVDHAMTSKHYRKDEHFWYFTDAGFQEVMRGLGFIVVAQSDMEREIGREDVSTYALRRC